MDIYDKFEEWIKAHPHLAGGNTLTREGNGYASSWVQSTFEAYKELESEIVYLQKELRSWSKYED